MRPLSVCFAHQPSVPASCSPPVGSSTHPVRSQFLDYPPLYYLAVGIPTLFSVGSGAIYGIQFEAAVLDAALLALGLFLLARYHPRRFVLVGAMVALTPQVLFVCAIVNSSGLEQRQGLRLGAPAFASSPGPGSHYLALFAHGRHSALVC